ncbi:MAG: hypothetical protein CL608_23785 [Anaerolineaceae bacterium]|nr:hypothetical protein [Anaerolineaceae bacterium]
MFGFRRVTPDNGHCLFFPSRPEGKRLVIGQSVWVKPSEQWRHIQLGVFPVQLSQGQEGGLFTTRENLECKVKAEIMVWIGGYKLGKPQDDDSEQNEVLNQDRNKERETNLDKATEGEAPNRDIERKIQYSDYYNRVANYAKTSIKRVLKTKTQIELIEDNNYLAQTVQEIEQDLGNSLGNIGLILLDSTFVLEPLEPDDPKQASKEILDAWRKREQIADEAALEKERDKADFIQREDELKQRANDHRLELKAKAEAKERELDIETQRALQAKKVEIDTIKRENDRIAKEYKLYQLGIEQELKSEELRIQNENEQTEEEQVDEREMRKRLREAAQLRHEEEIEQAREKQTDEREKRRRLREAAQLEHELEILRKRQEKLEMELEQGRLELEEKHNRRNIEEEINEMESRLERTRGETRVELIERETLAKSAHMLKMQELLLTNLPNILQEANRPIEKMGEIRLINLSGANENSGLDKTLSGILTSTSILPILKDMLRFIKDFEVEPEQLNRKSE